MILALSLLATHPDTLLGGQSYELQTQTRTERVETERSACESVCEAQVREPLRVGDPIILEPGFFDTPLSGGVGGQTGPIIIEHRGIIVIDGQAGRYGSSRLHWVQP